MRFTYFRIGVIVTFAVALAGCGSPGAPLPPSLELAKPVSDLQAIRKGNKVFLSWTVPTRTTDGRNIRKRGATQICRSAAAAMSDCTKPIADLAPDKFTLQAAPGIQAQGTFTDDISGIALPSASAKLFYAVNVLNPYGRSAALSNKAEVSGAPVLPPPGNFQARLQADGVHISWDAISSPTIAGLRFLFRIYRLEQAAKADTIAGEVPVGENSPATLLDSGFEWEKSYEYRGTVVTVVSNGAERQVEGEDTPVVTVIAHDIFAPATPAGLQAVFSGPGQKPFIDLIWSPNAESDLAGYNVYRHEAGEQPRKVNFELVKAPAFRDSDAIPSHEYFYSVSAVDVRGNESPRSDEASEKLPEQ